MNFTFSRQLLTIGHDCPAPVSLAVSKISSSPLDPLGRIKCQIFQFRTKSIAIFFTEIVHGGIGTIYLKHIKRDFSWRPGSNFLGDLGGGGRGQNSTFSEYGHVAHHIIGNRACSNTVHVTTMLSADTSSISGAGLKGQNICFSNRSHVHIKLKGMERGTSWKKIFCPYTHPRPMSAVKRGQIFFFSESGHVAYQMKGKEVLIDMQEKAST